MAGASNRQAQTRLEDYRRGSHNNYVSQAKLGSPGRSGTGAHTSKKVGRQTPSGFIVAHRNSQTTLAETN